MITENQIVTLLALLSRVKWVRDNNDSLLFTVDGQEVNIREQLNDVIQPLEHMIETIRNQNDG